jgi:HPt (histidine-containing phosphotransfer) domain-containing protein
MSKLYHLEYLEEISQGDKEFIADMLNDFVANAPATIEEIEKYVKISDWAELYKAVHKFIPSFEFVGAEEIKKALRDVESFSKSLQNTDQIPLLVALVKSQCREVVNEIKTDFKI